MTEQLTLSQVKEARYQRLQSINPLNESLEKTNKTKRNNVGTEGLLQRADSLERTLMMGKTEGKSRRGQQMMRWLDGIIDSMDMDLSKLGETVKSREVWRAVVCGVIKSWTWFSWITKRDWIRRDTNELKWWIYSTLLLCCWCPSCANFPKIYLNVHFKWVHCISCKLYLNKLIFRWG